MSRVFSETSRPGNPLNLRITIRMTVISAFVLATVLTAGVAIGLQYFFGYRLALDATRGMYTATSQSIAAEIRHVGLSNAQLLQLLTDYAAEADGLGGPEQVAAMARLMRDNPMFYGVYLAKGDGSFFEIVNLRADPQAAARLRAAAGDRWVISEIKPAAGAGADAIRLTRYLDAELRERTARRERTDFDPRTRDWYQQAIANDGVQRSDPYLFAQVGILGRTLSHRVPGRDDVLAIDITLSAMSRFLEQLQLARQSEIFLYNAEGDVLASSAGESVRNRVSIADLLQLAGDPEQRERLVDVSHRGEAHYAYGAPLRFEGDRAELFVGILTPRQVIIGPFLEKLEYSIAVAGFVLLLLLPLSWFFASPIVRPVRELAREHRKAMRRDYAAVRRIPSHVVELDQLSDSMVSMVGSIQDYERAQEELMESIIRLIAQTVDDKSPYTGSHCERVPELALMLAEQACASDKPPFDRFDLRTADQWREFRIAAWLHDCGKLTVPEHIVDKGSKLEMIYNRIHEIRTRFEVLWRDAEIDYLHAVAAEPERQAELAAERERRQSGLQADFAFVAACNVGGEELTEDQLARLRELADITWTRHFDDSLGLSPAEELQLPRHSRPPPATERLLSDRPEHIQLRGPDSAPPARLGIRMEIPNRLSNHGELYNLSVSRGTLTAEDRFRIEEHMISTIKMLESLPFPEELSRVPRLASTHHETLDGRGYPRRLSGDQLSIEERILAIADVFEALTAADRPYKRAKTIVEAIDILHAMVNEQHLDRDCFELFLRSGVYRRFAERFLAPEQIDTVDLARYLEG